MTGGLPPGLFDVPLPRWPAVALGPAVAPGPGNSDGDRGEDGDGVFAPDHGAVGPAAPWRPVAGPAGIIGALLTAAAGWRAVLRAQAPALRGGTALLAADPDGLGPFHSQAAVLRLAGRGHRAGVALRERFTGPDGDSAVHTGTDRYRWARMRTALARWRRESLAIGAGIPLYTDLALAYRVPDDVAAWFSPPLEPGTADPAWGDAVAALTHLRSLAEGGVLDWDTEWGAAPTDPHDRLG